MWTNTPDDTDGSPDPSRPLVTWRRGRVLGITRDDDAAVELRVGIDSEPDQPVPALAYVPLVGRPEVGDTVLLNVSAQRRGLGTGGLAFVVAIPDRLPADPEPGQGHVVKARYTPLQAMVLGLDEQESPFHQTLMDADSLHGMPVVVADLHSSLPAVIAGARAHASLPLRVVYVMTDGAALPAWFSRTVAGLRGEGWLDACITTGQTFGGDLEATSVHSGLLAAHEVVGADLVIVAQGPGNLGTGTRWGFSGVAVGENLNAVATLHGRPIAALRISQADHRERHHGISHHSLTALARVALAGVDIALPTLPDPLGAQIRGQAHLLPSRHRTVEVSTDGLLEALRQSPVELSTMGRGLDDDPAAFLAAAAAGRLAMTPTP